MTRGLLRAAVIAVALFASVAPAGAQGQFGGVTPSGRQAEDRRVDESSRRTESARQTEAPKPAEPQKALEPARSDAKGAVNRQPEPQRQAEPKRQGEPQRQHELRPHPDASRRNDSDHWSDPGPAWRSNGPAWRDLNDRPGVSRPGEDAFRARSNTYAPRDRDGRRDRDSHRDDRRRNDNSITYYGYPYAVPFGFAPYVPSVIGVAPPEPSPAPPAAAADEPPLGFLQLRVSPRAAEVYVDGALAGTVDDFGGRSARMLPAGPHRVEIVAPGYESVTFDVRVPENDTVTFTRDLERGVERRAPEPIAVPHKALYVVPMCYIGDRPPQPGDMPAGCRVEDMRVIP